MSLAALDIEVLVVVLAYVEDARSLGRLLHVLRVPVPLAETVIQQWAHGAAASRLHILPPDRGESWRAWLRRISLSLHSPQPVSGLPTVVTADTTSSLLCAVCTDAAGPQQTAGSSQTRQIVLGQQITPSDVSDRCGTDGRRRMTTSVALSKLQRHPVPLASSCVVAIVRNVGLFLLWRAQSLL